jgi:hypothetical protein
MLEKAHPLSNQKRNRRPHPRTPKERMRQCKRGKVISLGKRAEDEEKPFFGQLLQEGARKLLQAAIENQVID